MDSNSCAKVAGTLSIERRHSDSGQTSPCLRQPHREPDLQAGAGGPEVLNPGMGNLSPQADERVRDVRMSTDTLTVSLMDGRTIQVPLAWYPRLVDARPEQRERWEKSAAGYGIHWPELDEDLSTEGLLRGAPAP